jgi:hypothetical protein
MTDLPVPPAVRAQLLATEHWSLLATRSQTWSEVMSRIMAQFTFTSAVLVVLALVVQNDGPFRPLALGLGGAILLTGTLTAMRVHYASHEDAQLVRGMNRLRHAYIDIDPGVTPYLVAGYTDDVAGVTQTYTMGPVRNATQLLASASLFITGVTSIVAGGWVGILVSPAGTAFAVVVGVLAGLAYIAVFMLAGYRLYTRYEQTPGLVLFPTPTEDVSSSVPPAPPSPS